MVMTADFITPPVDDPYLFGQIAAANALSDVFAMGGKPVACLNLVGFPGDKLDPEVLHGIVAGALSKITEAGAVLAGGHTHRPTRSPSSASRSPASCIPRSNGPTPGRRRATSCC